MNESHDDPRWEDEIAAYALDALAGDERASVEAHLAGCDRCRRQLQWFEPAVRALPEAVPQVDPPRRLRRRLMREVRADAAASAAASENRRSRLRWLPPWLSPVAATAVLAAVVVGGVIGFTLAERGPGAVTVAGAPTSPRAPGAEAELVQRGSEGTLRVADLPSLRGGDVYQAWVRRGDEIEPSTVFAVDSAGEGSAGISGLQGADEVMVTREPRGGSEVPSTEPLLSVDLSRS